MSIPLQHDLNMNDPEEMFLWMFNALPGMEEQAPMLVPPQIARKWSQRLYDAGARFHAEEQGIKYVPPAGQAHWLSGTGGRWVPIDEELGAEDTTPDISHLSLAEKRELVKRLEAEGHIPHTVEAEEPLDTAEVISRGD